MEYPELSHPASLLSRVPVLFILDTSGGMRRQIKTLDGYTRRKVQLLNEGLEQFTQEIRDQFEAYEAVDISLVTFGGDVELKQEFTPIKDWTPPQLDASGSTPMCEAIIKGISHFDGYRTAVDDQGLSRKRVLVWLLIDGRPNQTDSSEEWEYAQDAIEQGTEMAALDILFIGFGTPTDTFQDLIAGADEDRVAMEKFEDGQYKEVFKLVAERTKKNANGDLPS